MQKASAQQKGAVGQFVDELKTYVKENKVALIFSVIDLGIQAAAGVEEPQVEFPPLEEPPAAIPSKVDTIIKQIDDGGFTVTPNPKTLNQKGNVTITHPNEPGVKLNLRSESHPLESGGSPVPHVNVERVAPGAKNRPVVKANTHITD